MGFLAGLLTGVVIFNVFNYLWELKKYSNDCCCWEDEDDE